MVALPLIYEDESSYAWTPEMGEEGVKIRISKSTLSNTKWCPQQLWLSKTLVVPEEPKSYLTVGTDVHNTVEEFYKRVEPESLMDLRKAVLEGKNRLVLETFRGWLPSQEEVVEMRRPHEKEEPFYERDYEINVDWLMRNEMQRLAVTDDQLFLPVANEVKLSPKATFHIDGEEVKVQLVGIIDRVFQDKDGLGLMELKTGKWKKYKLSDMRMEMSYYKMLIELTPLKELKALGLGDLPVTHWGWRYSSAGLLDYEKTLKVSERAMQHRLTKLIKMYLNQDFPVTKDDFKCSYCDYMDLCPKFKVN